MPPNETNKSTWNLSFTASAENAVSGIGTIAKKLGSFKENAFNAGVGIIYFDRLIYSTINTLRRFDEILGISRAAKYARDITYLANSLDIANERLQSLQYAFSTVGIDPRDMMDGINQIDQIITEFVSGAKAKTKDFQSWGFSVSDFANKDIVAQLTTISDKVAVLDRRARNNALSKMFGEDLAKKLGPLLALGKGALLEKLAQAYTIGQVLSEKNAKALSQVFMLFRLIKDITVGMTRQLSAIVSPEIIQGLSFIARSILEISIIFQNRLERNMKEFRDNIVKIDPKILKDLKDSFAGINASFEGIGNVMWRVMTAGSVGFLLLTLITNPLFLGSIALGLGAIAGAIAVVDDYLSFMSGEESIFGYLYAYSPLVAYYMDLFNEMLGIMGQAIMWAGRELLKIFESEGFIFFMGDAITVLMTLVNLFIGFTGIFFKFLGYVFQLYGLLRRIQEFTFIEWMGLFTGASKFDKQQAFRRTALTDGSNNSPYSNILNTLGYTTSPTGLVPNQNPQSLIKNITYQVTNNLTTQDPTMAINSLTNNVVNQSLQMEGL